MNKREAELKIAAILAELEETTGAVVKGISLNAIDITANTDVGRQLLMSVDIELERMPGHQWAT